MAINAAGGVSISSKPYFDLSDAESDDAKGVVSNLFVGGHGSMFYGSTEDEEGSNFLLYNFGQLAEGQAPASFGQGVVIKQIDVKHRYSDIKEAEEEGRILSTTALHKRTGKLFIKPQRKENHKVCGRIKMITVLKQQFILLILHIGDILRLNLILNMTIQCQCQRWEIHL